MAYPINSVQVDRQAAITTPDEAKAETERSRSFPFSGLVGKVSADGGSERRATNLNNTGDLCQNI